MSINAGNTLSATSLSAFMTSSLPKTSDPQLRNPHDAIALLGHACMIAVGFRLVGLGEDHKIEATSEAEDVHPLPIEWNATQTSDYAFRYSHSQSSLQYLIKISRLGSKAVFNGLGLGDEKVYTFDIQTKDYVSASASAFPFTLPPSTSTPTPSQRPNETLIPLFLSAGRIADLASLMKTSIIQKLAPGLHKEGYEDSAHAASHTSTPPEGRQALPGRILEPTDPTYDPLRSDRLPPPARPHPFNDPLADHPRRPFPAGDFPPPDFEDEYEIQRPPGRFGGGGERRPLNIGERDLYPPGLGPHDPLRIGGVGGGGYGPGGGGGMYPSFDDPLFGGNGGVGGYDSRAPPGARYDPIGPGDTPLNIRGGPRFPGSGSGGFGSGSGGFGSGGRGPNPFGGFGGNEFI